MARKKIKEVEDNDPASENSVSKKVANTKPRRQLKRKINESENTLDASEQTQRKKLNQKNSKKQTKDLEDSDDVSSVNSEQTASEPKQRGKFNQRNPRRSTKPKNLKDEDVSSVHSEEKTAFGNKRVKNTQKDESLANGEVVQTKKPRQARPRKNAESKNDEKESMSVESENTVAKPKKQSTRKTQSRSETGPQMKKAKVVLRKFNLDEKSDGGMELVSANSIDSDIIPDSMRESMNSVSAETLKNMKNSNIDTGASSSEEEWEEVEDSNEPDLDDYKPDIPKDGVEITIDCPDINARKRKKKQFDWRDWVRLHINRQRKEIQLNIHKTHLLCLLAHGFYVNNILNSPMLKGVALSVLPPDLMSKYGGKKVDKTDSCGIESIVRWFRGTFSFGREKDTFLNFDESIVSSFENLGSLNASEYNLMFVVLSRTLGFRTRFCISLYASTHKAQNLIKKSNPKKDKKSQDLTDSKTPVENIPGPSEIKQENTSTIKKEPKEVKPKKAKESKKPSKAPTKTPKNSESNDIKVAKRSRPKRSTEKSYKMSDSESEEDQDEDYVLSEEDSKDQKPPKKSATKTSKRRENRKVLSSESAPSSPEIFKGDKITCWAEVFSKPEKKWIPIECVNNIINKPYKIEESLPQPVTYIVAFDNDSYVKDLTRRYCSNYMTSTIKLRPDASWWEETLVPFSPPNSKLDKEEDDKLESLLINKPLPTTVAGFKNHPLYALKRHLLKFEGIYPPDAKPVGFMRGEPVYARECVCQLHSRETWLKEARVVRIGEEPYKIVKARPKWDRIAGVMRTDLPLEIFGFWQTEPYEPPIAVDGKVPRNEYGNVELFKPCMLPRGTVHLQLPGLNRIAKKLGIDCSPAVVGFDGHKGSVHAVFDGFIVCEEFKETLLAAWDEEQVNAQKREEEKREKRIYGNWKKLIRGLLIRERIKLKYDAK